MRECVQIRLSNDLNQYDMEPGGQIPLPKLYSVTHSTKFTEHLLLPSTVKGARDTAETEETGSHPGKADKLPEEYRQ